MMGGVSKMCAQKLRKSVEMSNIVFLRSQDVPQHESSIENCISERSVFSILSRLGPQTSMRCAFDEQ